MKHTSEQFMCVYVFYGLKDASRLQLNMPPMRTYHALICLPPRLPHCKHVVGAYGTCVYGIFN